ncbi:MAG: D-alanine--D-alanine ligase [Planctomycetota bacterium]
MSGARLKIGVLMGGISSEREVSLVSGRCVAAGLRRAGHRVTEIIVGPGFPAGADAVHDQDVLFNALHGFFGEDGQVQTILDGLGLAYTGSGPAASRLLMDKVAAKRVLAAEGIATPPGFVLGPDDPPHIAEGFGLPLVVKPPDAGSSVGVTIVRTPEAFAPAVVAARAHGRQVLVETFIKGREITVGVVGDMVLPVVELRPAREFYDYTAKYEDAGTQYLCPAPLPAVQAEAAGAIALRAFRACGCRDLCRFDMIVAGDGGLFVLEGNSIPGFTDHSLLPMAARTAGISFEELCDRIARMALARRRKTAGAAGMHSERSTQ